MNRIKIISIILILLFIFSSLALFAGYPGQTPVYPCVPTFQAVFLVVTIVKNIGDTGEDILVCRYTYSSQIHDFVAFCNIANPPQFLKTVTVNEPYNIRCTYNINNNYPHTPTPIN